MSSSRLYKLRLRYDQWEPANIRLSRQQSSIRFFFRFVWDFAIIWTLMECCDVWVKEYICASFRTNRMEMCHRWCIQSTLYSYISQTEYLVEFDDKMLPIQVCARPVFTFVGKKSSQYFRGTKQTRWKGEKGRFCDLRWSTTGSRVFNRFLLVCCLARRQLNRFLG